MAVTGGAGELVKAFLGVTANVIERSRMAAATWCCAVALALAACTASTVPPASLPTQPPDLAEPPAPVVEEVRVGLLVPLSGPAAALGQDMLRAAELALFDVGPNDLVLAPRDTGGTPTGAFAAAEQVIADGAALILGPLFNQAVTAISPLAEQAGVPVLAFSNVTEVAAPGTYLLGFRPEEQIDRVIDYALQQGLVRIAGLAADDAYGRTALQAMQQAVLERGGELAAIRFYPPDLADPSPVVREVAEYDRRREALEIEKQKLEGLDDEASRRALEELEKLDTFGEPPFDAILIADGGDRLRSVASLLTFYDVAPEQVRFLGTMRWQDDPRVLEEPALQGGWFAAPAPDGLRDFESRFEATFGELPQPLAALAYDATALAVIVARDLGSREFDQATLTNAEGFAGATGLFRLRPDSLTDHGLAVFEARGPATGMIDPPPTTFVDQLAAR